MTISLHDFLLAVLASQMIVELWLEGEIFANLRAYIEARGGWLQVFSTCHMCLTVHVTFWAFVYLLLFGGTQASCIPYLPMFWLAGCWVGRRVGAITYCLEKKALESARDRR